MNKAVFSPLIVALLLFGLVLFIPSSWVLPLITKNTVNRAATSLSPDMFQGVLIQDKMLKDPTYLPIYGSSELSRLDPFHPTNYFKANPEGFTPFLFGRGGTQTLVHFLNFATTEKGWKNKKLIFILSPQWFDKQGIDETHFAPNFSLLQGYEFALHPTVSKKLQQEGAKRLLEFDCVKQEKMLSILLKEEAYPNAKNQFKASLVKPFAYGFLQILERRDLVVSILHINTRNTQPNIPLTQHVPWNTLEKNAAQYGSKYATNNPFQIDNSYYNSILKSSVKKLKGYRKGQSFDQSPEYSDLQMMLDVLKESGAKPLFISIPVNGLWYDYAGFPKQGRTTYYQKVKAEIEKEGFPVADFSGHEYDPYFIKDTMHLGWKGWVYVDQAISDYMKK